MTRWWFWTVIGALLIAIGTGSWVGVRGLQAKSELETAQTLVGQLKTQALKQDIAGATKTLDTLRRHTAEAVELTSDPIWRMTEAVPKLGPNLTMVRELAAVTNSVITNAVDPLVQVASEITPASLAPKNGAINLAPFQSAVVPVKDASNAIHSAIATVDGMNATGTLSQLSAAKTKLRALLGSVAPMMETLKTLLPMLPPAMGADGPRNYVVMFENNAEARSLGGTALSFALVTMDHGKITLAKTVAAGSDNFAKYDKSVIPVPDGAAEVYPGRSFGTFIADATMRPSFVSAAQITSEMWKRQFGLSPDGVISIDPVALGYILGASQPIKLSTGDTLTGDTLVPLLLNQVYQRYWTKNPAADNRAQDTVYGQAVAATFAALSGGKFDAKKLLHAVVQASAEHRILFWSARQPEQEQFVKAGLAGELPRSDKSTDRIGVYFQDAIGSKMDYYLTQSVHLSQAMCRADGRQNYRVSVDLTNTAPQDALKKLSPSILGQWKFSQLKPGDQRMIVMLYAPPGSQIVGATVSGAPFHLDALHDTDYPVAKVAVIFNPGKTQNLTFDVVAASPGKKVLEAQVTPMVHATSVDKVPLDCATVPAS